MKKTKNNKIEFDKDFIFAAATAAYQVEGATNVDGRGKCIWDEVYHRPNARFNGDIASDFYNKYPLDLQMGKSIGMNGIRISISWPRIFPKNNKEVNQKGIDFYHRLIDKCLELNIEPMVTLHHFDSPMWLVNKGDWLSKESMDDFLTYAKVCFKEYGKKVKKWSTFNEPLAYNSDKYVSGGTDPAEIGRIDKLLQSSHNMMVAHAQAVNAYHEMQLDGKIGIVHVAHTVYPFNKKNLLDIEAAKKANMVHHWFMFDANYLGEYSKETMKIANDLMKNYETKLDIRDVELRTLKNAKNKTQFLGLNYYRADWIKNYDGETIVHHNGTGQKGTSKFFLKGYGNFQLPKNIKTTEWDWSIYPKGLLDIMIWVKQRYKNYDEMYVTENGIGFKEELDKNNKVFDVYRIDYIKKHLKQCLDAINEHKINLKGYYLWSWQDMLSWRNGYNKRYGLFFVDFKNQKRYYKLSAFWYKKVIEKGSLNVSLKKTIEEYEAFDSKEFKL